MNADNLRQENRELRERLSRLSEASLRISGDLDFDTVLQEVLDSARSLTGARYGVITLLDHGGQAKDFLGPPQGAGPAGPYPGAGPARAPSAHVSGRLPGGAHPSPG